MAERELKLSAGELAKMVTARFKLKRVLTEHTIRAAIRGSTWGKE